MHPICRIITLVIRLLFIFLILFIASNADVVNWFYAALYLVMTQIIAPAFFEGMEIEEEPEYDGELEILLEDDDSTTYKLSIHDNPEFNDKDELLIKVRRD